MSKKNSKPLWITAIVLVAIVTFIIYQNRKGQDQTPAAQTVGGGTNGIREEGDTFDKRNVIT